MKKAIKMGKTDNTATVLEDVMEDETVVLINYATCMLGGNEETFNQIIEVGKNPNVAACLVISMGCGSILPEQVANPINESGKLAEVITVMNNGGTIKTIEKGKKSY